MSQAQGGRAPLQRLANHIAKVFVPIDHVVAAGTFLTWLTLQPDPRITLASTA